MSSDEQPSEKKIKDFSAIVEVKIPEFTEPAKADKNALPVALENLLALEKKTRLAADLDSTKKLGIAIVNLCRDCKAWATLNDHIELLCKRRAQFSKVVQAVIQTAYSFVEDTPDKDTKVKLIEIIRKVSDGKIVVELERARLTRTLAEIMEADGDITKAAEIAQEIAVETCGAMEAREKTEFLLYQVKLCSDVKDFVRTEIIAKKIKPEKLEGEEWQDLKIRYFNLMIDFNVKKNNHLSTSQCYESLFRTKSIQEDEKQWKEAIARSVFFVAMAPWDHDTDELVRRLKVEKKVVHVPSFKQLLEQLTTKEIIHWPLKQGQDWAELLGDLVQGEEGKKRDETLHTRIMQHNIRVISEFYGRVASERLAELLGLSLDKTEALLSEMVSSKQLYAKIDRCVGRVKFTPKQTPNQILTEWAGDISSLLDLVEKTCHLINKENMVHGIKA